MKLTRTSLSLLWWWFWTTMAPFTVTVVTAAKHPPLTPADYLVTGLEKVEPAFAKFEGRMYAGLVPTTLFGTDDDSDDDDGALMFWLYAPSNPVHRDSLVVWLNGGPGCSSLGGMLFENGPVTVGRKPAGFFGIDPLDPLEYNPHSWTHATAMLYVEQPHGTGFAKGIVPQNETDVGRDFYHFLQNLFAIFEHGDDDFSIPAAAVTAPDLRAKNLYFFGESYAGMFVPSIAHYIHRRNQERKLPHIHLSGIGLGNGWMDATVQGPAVIDYAWWHGMIDTATVKAMKQEWKNCKDGSSHQPKPFHTFTVPDECGIMAAVLQAAGMGAVDWGGPNAYDVTTWDPYLLLDFLPGSIHQFYNNPAVKKALNVPDDATWLECLPGAGRRRLGEAKQPPILLPGKTYLAQDRPVSVVPYVAELLDEAGIRVLIYNGDRDMTTNAQGSELLLDSMEWSGAAGWADTMRFERGLWFPMPTKFGGYVKQYRNLEFLVVSNSGHLVPFNVDEIALDLITRFLGNVTYLDKPVPKFNIARRHQSSSNHHTLREHHHRETQKKSNVGGFIGSFLFAAISFVMGFLVSRRMPKRRGNYEMIPCHADVNGTHECQSITNKARNDLA